MAFASAGDGDMVVEESHELGEGNASIMSGLMSAGDKWKAPPPIDKSVVPLPATGNEAEAANDTAATASAHAPTTCTCRRVKCVCGAAARVEAPPVQEPPAEAPVEAATSQSHRACKVCRRPRCVCK